MALSSLLSLIHALQQWQLWFCYISWQSKEAEQKISLQDLIQDAENELRFEELSILKSGLKLKTIWSESHFHSKLNTYLNTVLKAQRKGVRFISLLCKYRKGNQQINWALQTGLLLLNVFLFDTPNLGSIWHECPQK